MVRLKKDMYIASASRGAGKKTLWGTMLRYKANGYIMGAGSAVEHLADRYIQDMGLLFAQTYTIYEIRQLGHLKLLKLRNPPGDHDEWKGDWSDNSSCWTKRLMKKLNVEVAEDDNCFWMSFDDFCNAFRCLYICRWYDEKRWKTQHFHGRWTMGTDDGPGHDTAAGLPSKHNPGCEIENNPHWSMTIHRPTDLKIKISQSDEKGSTLPEILPFSAFVVRPPHFGLASRIKNLSKDNVIADTGQPMREREYTMYLSLQPGTYMLLAGTYIAGMEGPFQLEVMSNYNVKVDQVWPPVWTPDTEPKTFAEKVKAKAKQKILDAAEKAQEMSKEVEKSKYENDKLPDIVAED